jgi:hypothetical protein
MLPHHTHTHHHHHHHHPALPLHPPTPLVQLRPHARLLLAGGRRPAALRLLPVHAVQQDAGGGGRRRGALLPGHDAGVGGWARVVCVCAIMCVYVCVLRGHRDRLERGWRDWAVRAWEPAWCGWAAALLASWRLTCGDSVVRSAGLPAPTCALPVQPADCAPTPPLFPPPAAYAAATSCPRCSRTAAPAGPWRACCRRPPSPCLPLCWCGTRRCSRG